uniref:HPSE_1 protein n=1 Tax=Fopius arisanus TaxID=64838 RepID=A0A0C9QLN5_9HYME
MTTLGAAAWLSLALLVEGLFAEEVILSVNTKRPLAITSEKFLSITLDPADVLTGNFITDNPERSVNMARALSPAYVRIAGPRSNSYTFARAYTTHEEDPSFIFTETQWNTVNGWAANSGLDVVAALTPQQHSEGNGGATRDAVWDSRNVLDLISFSDHMGFNISWQLGYECQTRCDISGGDLGKDVMRLRSMLEAFPRFARSIIAGPDVVTFKTRLQQSYLQEYLNAGTGGLSAITWHPDFATISLDPIGVSMHHDNLALDRDALYRIIGRHMAKKPLWLAESKSEECKKQFLGALVWTRRLGNSAKLAQVLMRQPQESNLFEPTPDYWVSVLYKTLVGREVLDTKIAMGNRTHIHFYCQCTRPSSKYEKGSLTVFGINLTPVKLAVSLKGLKIKTLHKYILLPGFDAENRMFSETVLLNNQPLKLENGKDMPEINPLVATSAKGLTMKLPSGGIGFWVIPDLKVKSCEGQENDSVDKMVLKKLAKRLEEFGSEEDSGNEEADAQEIEDDSDERRPLLKASKKRRKKGRYSAEEDELTRYKKLDARRDLERLEKLLRWRENIEERRALTLRGKPAHIGFDDKSYEINGDNASEEEIRAKLQMYKRRLDEYEARKRNSVRPRDKIHEENEALDRERIEEAMRLISKVENAMKSLEDSQDSLDAGNDIAAGLNVTNAEEHFLDELLKTRKIKRTSVPQKIEEQLRAIYEMLADEKKRRQRRTEESEITQVKDETLSRSRRDVDKKFGDDPLGLRKESWLSRRRNRNEDIKERKLAKLRKKGDKHLLSNSKENNFYGFAKRQPSSTFPTGDVYFMTAESSEENRNKDYDYVDDTYSEVRHRRMTLDNADVPDHEIQPWIEDENSEIGYIPKEFLETSNVAPLNINKHLANYGELFEAEALSDRTYDHENEKSDPAAEKILQQKPQNESQDKKVKEQVVKKLKGYYDNFPSDQSDEDETAFGLRIDKTRPVVPTRESPTQRPKKFREPTVEKNVGRSNQGDNFRATSAHRTTSSSELDAVYRFEPRNSMRGYRRPRRNIDSILNKEMIFQDENNLKDCHCRVIRGMKGKKYRDCKVCKRFTELAELADAKRRARRGKLLRGRIRSRRDAALEEEEEGYEYEEEDGQATLEAEVENVSEEIGEDVDFSEEFDDIEEVIEEVEQNFEPESYIRSDRDAPIITQTIPPVPTTTVPVANPPAVVTKKKLQVQKNINRIIKPKEKSLKRSPGTSRISEHIRTGATENESTEKINQADIEAVPNESNKQIITPDQLEMRETSAESNPHVQTATENPREIKTREATSEQSLNTTETSQVLETAKPTSKSLRASRKTQPKDKIKIIDNAKAREGRLTAKSQALLAKKPLETPSKILASETAKLQEIYRQRLEELEKLREKLKNKRKTLQESILVNELGKSADSSTKVIKRREIMQLLKEEQELQSIVDKGKRDYVMLYKPINYATLPKLHSRENVPESKYIFEYTRVDRPFHEFKEKTLENGGNTETLGSQLIIGGNSHDAIVENSEYPDITQYPMLPETNTQFSFGEPEKLTKEEVSIPETKINRGDRRPRLPPPPMNKKKNYN